MKRALPLARTTLLLLASCPALGAEPTLSLPELKAKLEAAENDPSLEEDSYWKLRKRIDWETLVAFAKDEALARRHPRFFYLAVAHQLDSGSDNVDVWLRRNSRHSLALSTLKVYVIHLASDDTKRALSFLAGWPGQSDIPEVLPALIEEIYLDHGELVVELVARFPEVDAAGRFLRQAFSIHGKRDFDQTVTWLRHVAENERLHTFAIGGLADTLYFSDPTKGAAWIVETREFSLLPQYVERWTIESPAEAAAWCAAERPYSGQESTLARCLQTWSRRDAKAAIAWTKDLKPTLHDQVVADLARFHRAKLPEVSETFRNQIRQDSLRSALAQELRTPKAE